MAIVGYARVSSEGQNLDRQMDSLKKAGAESIYTEKLSGKDTKRPELNKMLAYVREGDTVMVASFDRLARSLSDLLKLVETFKEKKVRLVSVKESLDTSTPAGKLQLALFGAIAEFEREIIAERRTEGIESARARGKLFGRPRVNKPKDFDKEVKKWRKGEQTAVETFKKLGMSKSVFYEMVKGSEESEPVVGIRKSSW
jgi:DNA invertase Pin-like site-specific DNA recombinase